MPTAQASVVRSFKGLTFPKAAFCPPDNIFEDPTFPERRVLPATEGCVLQAIVPYGRLVDFHSLILPAQKEFGGARNFGELFGGNIALHEYTALVERLSGIQALARNIRGPHAAVMFEHGGAYHGVHQRHVPGMHLVLTQNEKAFSKAFHDDEDRRCWMRITGWDALMFLDSRTQAEYYFVQIGNDAWLRCVDRSQSPQGLRRLMSTCLRQAGDSTQTEYLWRVVGDQAEALYEAALLRHLSGFEPPMEPVRSK